MIIEARVDVVKQLKSDEDKSVRLMVSLIEYGIFEIRFQTFFGRI